MKQYKIDVKKIEDFMEENCYSKSAFAKKCGISVWLLNKILDGYSRISVIKFLDIADFMEVLPSDLCLEM